MTPSEALTALGVEHAATPTSDPFTRAPDGRVHLAVRTPWETAERVVAAEEVDAALAEIVARVADGFAAEAARAREVLAEMLGAP